MKHLLHLTLTLLLGLILSSSSCSKDPDPILVPATQADFYGVWTSDHGQTMNVSSDLLIFTDGGASYTLEVTEEWVFVENTVGSKENYPTGYKVVGTLTAMSISLNVCRSDDTGRAYATDEAMVHLWLSPDKQILAIGTWAPGSNHFPLTETPFTK